MRRAALLLPVALATLVPSEASAYTTRVHIMMANRVRDALAVDGATVPLWQGEYAVALAPDDARAILNEPLAFRAGAVGPDNMILPGLTDPSHAVLQRPFEQCQRLYEAAVLDKERAYALGCFLHGATDTVAHHYVNYMTGETFTLNPITAGRQQGYANVVRHIIAEDMLQDAAYAGDPAGFTGERMSHEIPQGFVLRTYFDLDSPVYGLMASRAIDEYNQTIDENPGASLPEVIVALDAAPADHLVLLPVYVAEIQRTRGVVRDWLESELAAMQDWDTAEGAELLVWPGDDGTYGTKDDETDCSATCANLFAKYFVIAGLLEPRFDASGNELPPAWDKVSGKFGADLDRLLPSLVQVTANVSTRLNTGLDQGGGGIGELTPAAVEAAFDPLTSWGDEITTIDTQAIASAVSPDWLLDMDVFFQSFGIQVDVTAWIEAILEPVLAPIRDGIRAYAIEPAKRFVDGLSSDYRALRQSTLDEYAGRLLAAAAPELNGATSLSDFYRMGLYGHSYNISAAALGNREAVLPGAGAPADHGAASFDGSHTAPWMEVGACPHLRELIYPLGADAKGSLGLLRDGVITASTLGDDSPLECHGGSLSAFSVEPNATTCTMTSLDQLVASPYGSISRAYPPETVGQVVECRGIAIPGLPGPPEGGAGGSGGASADDEGDDDDDDGDGDGDGRDGASAGDEESSCDCRAAAGGDASSGGLGVVLGAAALIAARSRRRRR